MYIEKTTADERLMIAQAVDPAFANVSRARRLLMKVLADFFEGSEQMPIDRHNAEDIGDILNAVNDALWMAETDYFVTVGEYWAVPGGECYYEGAKQALLVRDVEQLREKLKGEDTIPCSDMSDEAALPILQELVARKAGVA